jgi:class III lanthionine synthetase
MHSPALFTEITSINAQTGRDYAKDLIDYDLEFINSGDYLEVGEIQKIPGWVLFISVIRTQLNELIASVLPVFSKVKISFKMVANEMVARKLLNGSQGVAEIGKIIIVYPENNSRAVLLARKLIAATLKFRGPAIPGCIHLGGCLYTSYETPHVHNKVEKNEPIFHIPKGISWPFPDITKSHREKQNKFLAGGYLPVMIMKSDVKGKVFKCISFKKIFSPNWSLVKQGKSNMCSDDFDRDIQDRLKWQERINKELAGNI